MKKIFIVLLLIIIQQSFFGQNINVNPGAGTYATLKAAFDAINAGTHTGAINITVIGNTTETATASLNASGSGSANYASISMQPSGGNFTIVGNINGSLITLNGADNVTVNGLNNGASSLTLSNENQNNNAITINFINDATNNTITNCTLLGATGHALSNSGIGTIYFGTGNIAGNDNNSILNNKIGNVTATTPGTAIRSSGSNSTIVNDNIIIDNNEIYNFFCSTISSYGLNINSFSSHFTITNNAFYQTATRTTTAGSALTYAIFISNDGTNYEINNNKIGGANATNTGAAWTIAGSNTNRFIGIQVAAAVTAVTKVNGNTLTNINLTTTSSASSTTGVFSAITITNGNAEIGVANGNIIGSQTSTGAIVVTTTSNSGSSANAIVYTGSGSAKIFNNQIGGFTINGFSATISAGFQGIKIDGGSPTIINNIIGSTTVANSINAATISTNAQAQRMAGIDLATAVASDSSITISNNTIANLNQNGTNASHYLRGIYVRTGSGIISVLNMTGNKLYNLTSSNAGTATNLDAGTVGIAVSGFFTPNITDNAIYNISANNNTGITNAVLGLGVNNIVGGNIARNKIYDLKNASTGSSATAPPMTIGIIIRAWINDTGYLQNNMISLGMAQTKNIQYVGIWNSINNLNRTKIIHNSINISGTITAGSIPSFGFLRGDNSATATFTTPAILYNNIFNITRNGGAAVNYALGNNYANAAVTTTAWESDFNILNTNTTTVGFWGAGLNFTQWKQNTLNDKNSIYNTNANFVDAANGDLHLNQGTTPTPIESGGYFFTAVDKDYDGQTRPGPLMPTNGGSTSSDIGADEIDAVPLDLIVPNINTDTLKNTSCLTDRTFTVTITDNSGINTTAGTKPRLYFKKLGHANNFGDNTNITDGWKFVEASNSSSPFSFTTNYSLLFGGTGVVLGDAIQYFVTAQDMANPNANVAVEKGIFALTPSSVALTSTAFPITGSINSYTIVNALPSNITIGATGSFTSLTGTNGLFQNINAQGITANTTVSIVDATVTETGLHPLYSISSDGCVAGVYSILIKPAASTTATLTGSVANNVLLRIHSSNVTIDGSNAGTTSRDLTITNTSGTSAGVIRIGNANTVGISGDTIKNCIINNGTTNTSAIILSNGNNTLQDGAINNITIKNNNLQRALYGIYARADNANGYGQGFNIVNNEMNSIGANNLKIGGVYAQGLNQSEISFNVIENMNGANAEIDRGIWIGTGCSNIKVSNNTIAKFATTFSSGYSNTGIYINTGMTNANINVEKNNIAQLTSIGGATGISTNGIHVLGNQSNINIYKNVITNIKNTSSWGANGILLSNTHPIGNISVYDNFISDVSALGFAAAISDADDNGNGITIVNGNGYKLYNNTVHLFTNQTTAGSTPAAILIEAGITTAGAIDLRNNIFSMSQTSGATNRYALISVNPSNAIFSNIDYNNYNSVGSFLAKIGTTDVNTLASLQTNFGGNAKSLLETPVFVSNTDLHLRNNIGDNCNLENRAITLTPANSDIDDITRQTTTDMGADDFIVNLGNTLAGVTGGAQVCDINDIGASYTFKNNCGIIAKVTAAGASPISGTANGCVQVLLGAGISPRGYNYNRRKYDIEPANNASTATANIVLYYTAADFTDFNDSLIAKNLGDPMLPNTPPVTVTDSFRMTNIRISQFHGTGTGFNYPGGEEVIEILNTNVQYNTALGLWQVSFPVTGFSGFYLHTSPVGLNITAPVLRGLTNGNQHKLTWKITPEKDIKKFEIEMSYDGVNYSLLQSMEYVYSSRNEFSITTETNKNPTFYRVKQILYNGKFIYSNQIKLEQKGAEDIGLVNNLATTKIVIIKQTKHYQQYKIINTDGKTIQTGSLGSDNFSEIGVANLASGFYIIHLTNNINGKIKAFKFTKQ